MLGADDVSSIQILTNKNTGVITLVANKIILDAATVTVKGLNFECNAAFTKGKTKSGSATLSSQNAIAVKVHPVSKSDNSAVLSALRLLVQQIESMVEESKRQRNDKIRNLKHSRLIGVEMRKGESVNIANLVCSFAWDIS